ncbi:hypothetical protein BT69DRAFT_1344281 [Atractiella rhizophila]|nr:hypothetical protein BT69DRAFT_1344281 [Atractiella rhizophila]
MFESIENGVPPSILEEKRRTLLLAEDIFVPDQIPGQNLHHLVTQVATAIKLLLDSVQVKSSEDPGTSSRSNSNSYTSFVEVLKSVRGRLETPVSDGDQGGSKGRELQQAAAVTASCHPHLKAHLYHLPQPPFLQDFPKLLTEDIKNIQAIGGSVETFENVESGHFQQPFPVGVEVTPAETRPTDPASAAPVPLSDYPLQQQLNYTIQSPYPFPSPHFLPPNPSQQQFQPHPSHYLSPYAQTAIPYDNAAASTNWYLFLTEKVQLTETAMLEVGNL